MGHEKESFERECIMKLLSTSKGETYDICAKVFQIISKSESQVSLFRYFLEASVSVESDESIEIEVYFTDSEIQKLTNSCEDMVNGVLNKLAYDNLDEKVFYIKLWETIQNNDLFSTNDEKIYALYSVFSDKRIPYFKLDNGLRMSGEELANISESMQAEIHKAVYILNTRLEQRTEVTSLLMKLLNSCDTFEKQSVLLAYILKVTEQQSTELFSRSIVEKMLSK